MKVLASLILINLIMITNMFAQGGATPNELYSLAADFIQNKDYESFGKLYTPFDGDIPEEIDAMIGIVKLYPQIIAFKNAGLKKFGEDFEYEIISSVYGMELDYGVDWRFDFEAAKNSAFTRKLCLMKRGPFRQQK